MQRTTVDAKRPPRTAVAVYQYAAGLAQQGYAQFADMPRNVAIACADKRVLTSVQGRSLIAKRSFLRRRSRHGVREWQRVWHRPVKPLVGRIDVLFAPSVPLLPMHPSMIHSH